VLAFALIMAGCVLFGLLVGRLGALFAALPFGVLMGLLSDPWEVSKFYCGVLWTIAGSAGIALGLVVRTVTQIGAGLARRKQARLS
jgi:hypothetical protein